MAGESGRTLNLKPVASVAGIGLPYHLAEFARNPPDQLREWVIVTLTEQLV
jgi:hypothetical protein